MKTTCGVYAELIFCQTPFFFYTYSFSCIWGLYGLIIRKTPIFKFSGISVKLFLYRPQLHSKKQVTLDFWYPAIHFFRIDPNYHKSGSKMLPPNRFSIHFLIFEEQLTNPITNLVLLHFHKHQKYFDRNRKSVHGMCI